MNNPILTTKLCFPILRKDIIPRVHLIERLNAGLWQQEGFVRKLTLVSAPAGFGKTTLVSKWLSGSRYLNLDNGLPSGVSLIENPLSNHHLHVAWLSLDESENDPSRFLAYLIAALRTLQPGFGEQTELILHLPQPPPDNVILNSLVNELSVIPASFVLALDDYHTIHTTSIHQQLAFILDHQPANMHLVILTREDPLLPVARLRARGQLLEIRQEDLRFTREEIAEFLVRGTGLSFSQEDIAALEHHTEGWAAGLQLAALSMRGRDELTAFIHDFTASDRYILDYLLEEVFKRQPADVQDFLLQTSILNRLNDSLCDAITQRNNSRDVLQMLEQSNLFIIPLDPPRTWYRYHHLFAELLHHRLHLSGIPEACLHQRASQWYEEHNFPQEAVDHSLLAQDWENAARLIGAVNQDMFKRGEVVTLLGWCRRLPSEVIHHNTELCLIFAWAALMASQFDLAAPVLERAEQLAPPGSYLLGQVASAQAFLARAERDNSRAIAKSEQALALLPASDVVIRGNIAMNLGLAYWHEGRMADASDVLAQACEMCAKAGNVFALLTAQIFLARVPAVGGKLHRAAAMSEKVIQDGGQIPILCLAHYDLATIHLEWNDLPEAMEHFKQGFALSQRSGNVEFQQSGHLLQAILAQALGDKAGALAALAEADALARDFPAVVRSRTAALGVQLALARNDPQMLAHWSAQVNAEVDAHSFYRFMGLTRPRLLIAQGDKAEAAKILSELSETASSAGWNYGLLVVRILQSLAAKKTDDALPIHGRCLTHGAPGRFHSQFCGCGQGDYPAFAGGGFTRDRAGICRTDPVCIGNGRPKRYPWAGSSCRAA